MEYRLAVLARRLPTPGSVGLQARVPPRRSGSAGLQTGVPPLGFERAPFDFAQGRLFSRAAAVIFMFVIPKGLQPLRDLFWTRQQLLP